MVGLAFASLGPQQSTTLLGRWVGESHCVGRHPACHDEHVVYQFDSTGPERLTLQGSRIAGRDTVAMGALTCTVSGQRIQTVCEIPVGVWHFSVVRGHLEGILTLTDGTVMRRVAATREQPDPRLQRRADSADTGRQVHPR